jgi:DNA-binding NarL/FixJ family response regulator
MKIAKKNLYILSDNALIVNGLRHYLNSNFGESIQIIGFCDTRSFLQEVNTETDIVVLDYFIEGKDTFNIRRHLNSVNPMVKVVIHLGKEHVLCAVKLILDGNFIEDETLITADYIDYTYMTQLN